MSTHAIIGLKQKDGSVKSIYCHYDGYISHVGKILLLYYENEKIISELISKGALKVLSEKPGECDILATDEPFMNFWSVKDFSNGLCDDGKTTAFHYVYLFQDGRWLWKHLKDEFKELAAEINIVPAMVVKDFRISVSFDPKKFNPFDIPDLIQKALKIPGLQIEEVRKAK